MGQAKPDFGSVPRTSGDRRGIWRKSGAGAYADARQDVAGDARRKGNLQERSESAGGDALPFAGDRIKIAAERSGSRSAKPGRSHGDTRGEASPVPGMGCAIPPGVDSDAERKGDSAKLSQHIPMKASFLAAGALIGFTTVMRAQDTTSSAVDPGYVEYGESPPSLPLGIGL